MAPSVPSLDLTRVHGAAWEDQPMSEDRRAQLSVRASWSHIQTKLQDRAAIEAGVRSSVAAVEGMDDAVVTGMIMRHVSSWQMHHARSLTLCLLSLTLSRRARSWIIAEAARSCVCTSWQICSEYC